MSIENIRKQLAAILARGNGGSWESDFEAIKKAFPAWYGTAGYEDPRISDVATAFAIWILYAFHEAAPQVRIDDRNDIRASLTLTAGRDGVFILSGPDHFPRAVTGGEVISVFGVPIAIDIANLRDRNEQFARLLKTAKDINEHWTRGNFSRDPILWTRLRAAIAGGPYDLTKLNIQDCVTSDPASSAGDPESTIDRDTKAAAAAGVPVPPWMQAKINRGETITAEDFFDRCPTCGDGVERNPDRGIRCPNAFHIPNDVREKMTADRQAAEVAAGKRCPTCDSRDPARHPAMQHEGEVQPCADPFHNPGVEYVSDTDPKSESARFCAACLRYFTGPAKLDAKFDFCGIYCQSKGPAKANLTPGVVARPAASMPNQIEDLGAIDNAVKDAEDRNAGDAVNPFAQALNYSDDPRNVLGAAFPFCPVCRGPINPNESFTVVGPSIDAKPETLCRVECVARKLGIPN